MVERAWTIRQYVDLLKEEFPLDRPVRVQIRTTHLDKTKYPYSHDHGRSLQTENMYYITLSKNDKLEEQKDAVMHEWAHCMVWKDTGEDHCAEWGKAYAKVFRLVEDL